MGARRAQFNIFSLIHLQVVLGRGHGHISVIYLFFIPIDAAFFSDTPCPLLVSKYSSPPLINVCSGIAKRCVSPSAQGRHQGGQ